MSEENLEVAKALYPGPIDVTAMFSTESSLEAARAYYEPMVQPDFETIHDPDAVLLGVGTSDTEGVPGGIDGFIALWREFLTAWESWVVTPTQFLDAGGDRVLVLMSFHGRSKTHGVDTSLDGGNLLTLRGGKLARLQMFFKRGDALEAAGLSEQGPSTASP